MTATTSKRRMTAEHRPAPRPRRYRHDDITAVDLLSGFGGLTKGIEAAGVTTIMAANHDRYKVEVHEANHPHAEHWIADLVDEESGDYHSAADLPPADMLVAGISCRHQSQANSQKAYAEGLNLFSLHDPEWEERVTRSERDRATAVCILQYAAKHHPRVVLIECTTELQSWGPQLPGRRNVGDGSSYRWWLGELTKLGYRHRVLFLNSQFFGVAQSRDRIYICLWDRRLRTPELDHRPLAWCARCDVGVEAVWAWRTGIPPTGSVRYAKQYDYRCPRCSRRVEPAMTPSITAIDFTDLGTKIGERRKPLAASSLARAERCRRRLGEFPAVLVPAKAARGVERHPFQPMATQTSQQETALLSTGVPMAIDNWQGTGRPVDAALPAQAGPETLGLLAAIVPNRANGTPRGLHEATQTIVANAGSGGIALLSAGVVPYRRHTTPTTPGEPMPTFTANQVPALLTGYINHNAAPGEAGYRAHPLSDPFGTVAGSSNHHAVLLSGWVTHNGGFHDTAPHPLDDPLGTLTTHSNISLITAEWRQTLAGLPLEDHFYRMLFTHEVGRGCGFDVDFPGHDGTWIVWGSARAQVDGYGNAVSPPVGTWIGRRLKEVL